MLEILARDLAIKITPLSPALAPVYVKDYAFGDLSGMSFKNVRLTIPAGENTASGGAPEHGPAGGPGVQRFRRPAFRGAKTLRPGHPGQRPPHGGGREVSDRFFG